MTEANETRSPQSMVRTESTQPDPSPRTLEQLQQAIKGLDEKVLIRFSAYDKAITLLQDTANKSPTAAEISKDLLALKELTKSELSGAQGLIFEKFLSVKTQFEQNSVALSAALSAAKEAVAEQNKSNTLAIDKSEQAVKKQLDAILSKLEATEKAADGRIGDLKDRLTSIESRTSGIAIQRAETKETTRDSLGFVFGVIGAAVALIGVAIAILAKGA